MRKVTQAEILINEICGQIFTGTIPPGVEAATKEFSRYFMNVQMQNDEWIKDFFPKYNDVMKIVNLALTRHMKDDDYTASADLFNLANLRDY